MMKRTFPWICAAIMIASCSPRLIPIGENEGAPVTAFAHPEWSHGTNIYEVNVRQYSAEGTFDAFAENLVRLKKMGVEILWFMPITPIGVEGRKENENQLGSYYAVRNYRQVNPEFGTMQDWKELVEQAHDLGMKVIVDWVANHTAPDNPWIRKHPDFYEKDDQGNFIAPFDWTDVRQLDYDNRALRDSMIALMKYWVTETNIDGFRCDVAHHVPLDFWKECISELRELKHVFMLAEAESPEMHYSGFDATYTWSIMHLMEDVYSGAHTVPYFDSVLNHNISVYPENAYRVYFTTNHDENSWNGTEFEKYGDAYPAFAVFTQTMYRSIPLIYSGQEEPNKRRLAFFVRDPIQWGTYSLAPFYTTLLQLRERNEALDANAAYQRLATANDEAIFAYVRQKGKNKVVVILNLSPQPQRFTIKDEIVFGKPKNVFTKEKVKLTHDHVYSMQPWEYMVLEY